MATFDPQAAWHVDGEQLSLRTWVKALRGLGISEKILAPLVAPVERAEALSSNLSARRTAADQVWADAVNHLVRTGEITDDVLTKFDECARVATSPRVASREAAALIKRGVDTARATLLREAELAGPAVAKAAFPILVKIANEAVATVTAVKVPASAIDERSFLGAKLGGDAWTELGEASARFGQCHKVYSGLRKARWLPGTHGESFDSTWLAYADPGSRVVAESTGEDDSRGIGIDSLVRYRDVEGNFGLRRAGLPGGLGLAHSIRLGAGPGLYTVDEARKRYAAHLAAKLLAERRAERGSILIKRRGE